MKLAIMLLVSLVSTAALADGYVCEGRDSFGRALRAKIYNHVRPEDGTRSPALLVVSESGRGTLAVLDSDQIKKTNSVDAVVFTGQTHGYEDGRFVSAELSVEKEARADGTHDGKLLVKENNVSAQASVICEYYRKTDRR